MASVKYVLVSAMININGKNVISYGIRCIRNGKVCLDYPDVLPDKAKVANLVRFCNEFKVCPLRIPKILEDFVP